MYINIDHDNSKVSVSKMKSLPSVLLLATIVVSVELKAPANPNINYDNRLPLSFHYDPGRNDYYLRLKQD